MKTGEIPISVIIPVYNAEEYLARCMESVLAQTHRRLEIILINDGSTDESGTICDEYARRDSRVIVIHQANGGVSAARNAGLARATGRYIGFADADDTVMPRMFEKLLEAIRKHGKQTAVCGHVRFHVEGPVEVREQREIPESLDVDKALEYLLSSKYFEGFLWNKLFDAGLVNGERGKGRKLRFDTDLHFCEDLLFVNRCLLKSNGIAYVPEALYHYRLRETGLTRAYGDKRRTELEAWRRIIELNKSAGKRIVDLLKFRYLEAAVNLCRMAVLNKDIRNGSYFRKEAMRHWRKYFFSGTVSVKEKVRCVLIMLFPRASDKIWGWLKRRLGVTWYKKGGF